MTDAELARLLGRPVVFLDVETTGTNPATDRVIEVAAIRITADGGEGFHQVVNPGIPIPPQVTELTGITQEQVDKARSSYDVFTDLWGWLLGTHLLVAHNAPFDLAFVNHELRRHGHPPWKCDFICTRALAVFTQTGIQRINRGGYPYLSTKLADVCEALGVTLEGAHRAINDIMATKAVFPLLYDKALRSHRPILNAMVHPRWLADRGQQPDYTPPRAVVYLTA